MLHNKLQKCSITVVKSYHCRRMSQEVENRCCNSRDCVSLSARFRKLCLDPDYLQLSIKCSGDIRNDRQDNSSRAFRKAAYIKVEMLHKGSKNISKWKMLHHGSKNISRQKMLHHGRKNISRQKMFHHNSEMISRQKMFYRGSRMIKTCRKFSITAVKRFRGRKCSITAVK